MRAVFIAAGVLPWLPWLFADVPLFDEVGRMVEAWFAMQCHREPERSLAIASRQLPVCARCLGIYLGLGLGALCLRPRLGPAWLKVCVGVAALVMLLDVLTEALDMRPESALVRVATGLMLAWPISVELTLMLRQRARLVR
jgi:uncharacterized membrane protein